MQQVVYEEAEDTGHDDGGNGLAESEEVEGKRTVGRRVACDFRTSHVRTDGLDDSERCCGCDGSGDGDLADLSYAKRCPRGPDVKEVKKTGRCGGAGGPVDSGTAQISSAPIALYARLGVYSGLINWSSWRH